MLNDFELIEQLRKGLEKPLPGERAQFKMAPATRKKEFSIPDNAMQAAVMLLLFPKNNNWHTVLIQRTSNDNTNDRHSGQVSFPGGKLEKSDSSFEDCAKRETFEEIGVPESEIKILGALSPLYIPVSNFHVFPYVGFVEKEPFWQAQHSEVKEILTIPTQHFFLEENKGSTDIKIMEYVVPNVPHFNVEGKIVWGATAMILNEFCEILLDFNAS